MDMKRTIDVFAGSFSDVAAITTARKQEMAATSATTPARSATPAAPAASDPTIVQGLSEIATIVSVSGAS
jgi:hypothetical protein